MPRATTTSDVFNAIAEPRRREIVRLLADGRPQSVGQIVETLGLAQPAVSKHLGVLRTVGVVTVEQQGKEHFYSLNPAALKPVHDWVRATQEFNPRGSVAPPTDALPQAKQLSRRFALQPRLNNCAPLNHHPGGLQQPGW